MIKQSNLASGRLLSGMIVLCGLGLYALTGCQPEPDTGLLELQNSILTDQCPSDHVVSLAEALAEFEDGNEVCVVGRIFADGMSPFDREAAAFNLIELPKPGHDHENPGDCPFCKREMENAAMAIVQVVDDSGQVLKTPAEKLLDLKKNQDLVVEGEASKVGDILIVNASSVHVLSSEEGLLLAKRIHDELED